MWYFTQEMQQSREYLDRVKETEIALQNLLNMKSRKAIVESDKAHGRSHARWTTARSLRCSRDTGRPCAWKICRANWPMSSSPATMSCPISTEISSYIKDQRELFRSTPRGWPVEGRITSGFGQRRDPFEQAEGEFHRGLDIANALGHAD